MYTHRFGEEAPGFDDLIQRCRCDGRDALRAKPNVKLGTFARDASDGNQRTARGASFVAFASTILIAQKFREIMANLQPENG
jgi:hypothetical protein